MKPAKFLLIVILILAVPLAVTFAADHQPVIFCHLTSIPPEIDGEFHDTEPWMTPQLELNPVDDFQVHAFVHFLNDENDLYILVDAANWDTGDYSKEDEDHCTVMFHNPADGPIIIITVFGREDVFLYKDDVQAQNLNGIEAAAGFGVSPNSPYDHRIYEFKIPLAALDVTETGARWLHFSSLDPVIDSLPFDWNGGSPRINKWPKDGDPYNFDTWGILVLAREYGPVGGEIMPLDWTKTATPYAVLGLTLLTVFAIRSRKTLKSLSVQ